MRTRNIVSTLLLARFWLLALLALSFASSAIAAPGVTDDAKFFTPETVQKVNGDLKLIEKDFGKELVIETFATVPESMKADYEAAKDDKLKRAEFFAKWLGERAHELKVNGVYVLVSRDPAHLEVKAGAKTREKGEFTQLNSDRMRDILVTAFKAKNYDEGLQKSADYFRASLKENLGGVRHTGASVARDEQFRRPQGGGYVNGPIAQHTPPMVNPPAGGSSGMSFVWIIVVIIGAILIIRVLSGLGNRSGGGSANYGGTGYGPGPNYGNPGYGGGYGSGGGGGFFRNMLGGMLGGAAGGYLYDKFSDRNRGGTMPYQGGDPQSSSGDFTSAPPADDNDRGEGFTGGGSGGDFGGSSDSGSSFGSSGGDFGGSSDSGSSGGGDSGGSSGGDF